MANTRKSKLIMVDDNLWIDFGYHCKKRGLNMSQRIEELIKKDIKRGKENGKVRTGE